MADFFQDLFDSFRPDKGLRILVVDLNVVFDGADQLRHTVETPAPNALACDLRKPPLHQVQPRRTGRREMQVKPRMFGQPASYLRVLVGAVVIDDQVQRQGGRRLPVDLPQKLQKLIVAMPLKTAPDDFSLQHIQRRKQGGRTMPHIVMRQRATAALFHRQSGLDSVQRLNLALLIHAQHHGLVGWVQIQANHVRQLLDKGRIAGQFKGADAMRLQPMGIPDAGHRHVTDATLFGQGAGAPVRGVARRRVQGRGDNRVGLGRVQALDAHAAGSILLQGGGTALGKALPPQQDGGAGSSELGRDPMIGQTFMSL